MPSLPIHPSGGGTGGGTKLTRDFAGGHAFRTYKEYAVYPDIRHPWKVFCVEYAGFARGRIGLLGLDDYAFVIR
jgi:hypothetical protein